MDLSGIPSACTTVSKEKLIRVRKSLPKTNNVFRLVTPCIAKKSRFRAPDNFSKNSPNWFLFSSKSCNKTIHNVHFQFLLNKVHLFYYYHIDCHQFPFELPRLCLEFHGLQVSIKIGHSSNPSSIMGQIQLYFKTSLLKWRLKLCKT